MMSSLLQHDRQWADKRNCTRHLTPGPAHQRQGPLCCFKTTWAPSSYNKHKCLAWDHSHISTHTKAASCVSLSGRDPFSTISWVVVCVVWLRLWQHVCVKVCMWPYAWTQCALWVLVGVCSIVVCIQGYECVNIKSVCVCVCLNCAILFQWNTELF